MPDAVLTLNAGSSSVKFALFETGRETLSPFVRGQIDGIGTAPHFAAKNGTGAMLAERHWPEGQTQTQEQLFGFLLQWVEDHLGADKPIAVGHRVVHGGPDYDRPALVTAPLLDALEKLTPLAPLHQPHNLSPIRAVAAWRAGLPQVVCFDTAFHHGMPGLAARLALPRDCAGKELQGLRRYGFHGLSYEYIAQRLRRDAPDLAAGRVIVAHLGNGASLCAMRDGKSVDTTMGFSALDGLVMGTRCGSIDPGVLLYLQQTLGMSATDVEDLLYHRSGLLGVSGISSDMQVLLDSKEAAAAEAVELFAFRLAREAGGLISSLGGLDGFVFTAGIGEHAPQIREKVCARLAWTGAVMDGDANNRGALGIGTALSRIDLRVMATDEEAMIAQHTIATMI